MTNDHHPDTPRPTGHPALASRWSICSDAEHPDRFTVIGSVAGEDYWEGTGPETEAHSSLRAEAIVRLPAILAQLEEACDILHAISHTDASGQRRFPDFTRDDGTHDPTGRRMAALISEAGGTLNLLEVLAEGLGLNEFAVAERSARGLRAVSQSRFSSHTAAHDRARELSAAEARDFGVEIGPEFLVIPARLVDGPDEG